MNEPPELYTMDVVEGDIADMFSNFLYNTGINVEDREFGVGIEDYYGGSFLLAWDRTPDDCNRFHRHIMDSGSIDINIQTKNPIQETVTVIVYATYSSDIIIQNGIVTMQAF